MNHSEIHPTDTPARHQPAFPPAVHTQRPGRGVAVALGREAIINVRNLRLRTFVGFNPEERHKKQDVIVNIEVGYLLSSGVVEDRVEDALDYEPMTKKVIEHVENGRFLLLERLAAEVLQICSGSRNVNRARVSVEKPHALRFADSVSMTLEYHAGDAHHGPEELR